MKDGIVVLQLMSVEMWRNVPGLKWTVSYWHGECSLLTSYCMLLLATPIIVTHPKSVVSKEGGTKIFLSCSAYDFGIDHVQYNWEKYHPSDGRWIRLSRRHRRKKLIFSVITEEDEGVYHCIATNSDGSVVSNNATITVYGELKFYRHTINFKTYDSVCDKSSQP